MTEKVENSILNQMLYGTGVNTSIDRWYNEEYQTDRLGPMRGFFYAALFSIPFWTTIVIMAVKIF